MMVFTISLSYFKDVVSWHMCIRHNLVRLF